MMRDIPLLTSEIHEEQSGDRCDQTQDPERLIRDFMDSDEILLDFIREGEIGQPFDDQDHPQDTKEIFHGSKESPALLAHL